MDTYVADLVVITQQPGTTPWKLITSMACAALTVCRIQRIDNGSFDYASIRGPMQS